MRSKQLLRASTAALLVAFFIAAPVSSQQTRSWSFDGVDRIEIDGLSGDLIVRAGTGGGLTLELEEDVRPASAFRPEVEASGGTLRVREDWDSGSSRGGVRWTLRVPAGADLPIAFENASGDLHASGVAALFTFDTASGNIELRDMTIASGSSFDTASGDLVLTDVVIGDGVDFDTSSGDMELTRVRAGSEFRISTASGDVRIEDSDGVTRASTASGSVRVTGSAVDGPSEYSSASGDVTMVLDRPIRDAVELSSASGDVRLEAVFGDDFTLVMSKRRDRGDIDSPFDVTRVEEYRRDGRTYVRQTVVMGVGGPEIRLHTASGSIEVRRR